MYLSTQYQSLQKRYETMWTKVLCVQGCWCPRHKAACRAPMGCCEAFCAPYSSILLDFILHLFHFWFFTTLRSHVKIKNWENVLNSKKLFLNCSRDFYSSVASNTCLTEIQWQTDVHSLSQVQFQVKQVYLSQHLGHVPYARKKPKKPRSCWNIILRFVGPSKWSSSTHFLFWNNFSNWHYCFCSILSLKN